MAILIRNTSQIHKSYDGVHVLAGSDLDVTGWNLSGLYSDVKFVTDINNTTSGITVVDTIATSGISQANVPVQGVTALQLLKLEPTVRTFNGVSGDIIYSGAETISARNPNTGLIESVYNNEDILVGFLG